MEEEEEAVKCRGGGREIKGTAAVKEREVIQEEEADRL